MLKQRLLIVLLIALLLTPMSAIAQDGEANKKLVLRFVEELWNEGKLEIADEILADDFVVHFNTEEMEDRETYVNEYIPKTQENFQGFSIDLIVMIAEGDYVALADNWGGTVTNDFVTDKEVRVNGISFYRIEDGKIAEMWMSWSTLSLSQQMGLMPAEMEMTAETPWEISLGTTSSTPQEHKVARSLNGISINEGLIDLLDQVYTEDAVVHWHSFLMDIEGLDVIKETWTGIKAENPIHRVSGGLHVGEGDILIVRGWIYGGSIGGINVATVWRFEDGKMAEQWDIWDTLLSTQLEAEATE